MGQERAVLGKIQGISSGLPRPVIAQREFSSPNAATVRDGSAEAEVYAQIRVIPADEWFAISGWAKETGNLAPWQHALAYSLGRLAAQNKPPSTKQIQQGEKILQEARRLGFKLAEKCRGGLTHPSPAGELQVCLRAAALWAA